MFRFLVRSSLRLRFLFLVAAVALITIGFAKRGDLPTDLLPEFSPPIVQIQTEALGLSAAEVEQLITVPLEADLLNGVAWLDRIRSESIPSVSSIELIFQPGTDLMEARQMVQEKLTQAHGLPNVSKAPVMLQPVSSTSRVLKVGLRSDELSLIEMSVLARWNIRPRLMGVPGVAHVSIWGQRKRQLQVHVDPDRIKEADVGLRDVVATTGNALWVSPLSFLDAAYPGTGGFIDTPNQRLGVRHVLPIVSPEGLSKVTIEGKDQRLGDVVEVVESHQPLIGDAIVGNDSGIMLVIEKFPWANTLDVTRGVEKALDDLRPGLTGVEIDTEIFRPASFIEDAVDNLNTAVTIGILLAAITLLLFFLDWRMTLIVVISTATSLMVVWFVLFLTGARLDILVLTGIMTAAGVIVHDAVLDTHAIRHRLAGERPEGKGVWTAILDAASEMRGTMASATLVVLLLVLPFLFVSGVLGAFFHSVGLYYAIAVVASLAVTLLLTPALCLLILPKDPREIRHSPLSKALQGSTKKIAEGFSAASGKVYAIAGVALLAVAVGIPFVHSDQLVPEFRERDLLIQWNAKPGTSQPAMSRITGELVRELGEIPGIDNVGAHVGRAVTSDLIVGINASQVWANVDPEADYNATLAAVESTIDGYPGLDVDLTTYSEERIAAVRVEEDDKLVVRVYGQDTDVLAREAQKVKDVLGNIEGIAELEIKGTPIEPTVEIQVDLERAQEYGIKPGDVRRAAATLLSGLEVGSLFEEKKVFDVVVWGTPDTRSSLSDIKNLLIETPTGQYIRLKQVADVGIKPHPTVIRREGVARYVDVEADIFGRGIAEVANEIQTRLEAYSFPLEYHAEVLGDYRFFAAGKQQVLAAVLTALIGIFLVIQAALRSWRLAAVLVLSLPVSVLGGILVVLLAGAEFSLGSLLGLLLVTALAARLAIKLYLHFEYLERREGLAFGAELVARGTFENAIPAVAAILVTAAALLPFALLHNSAGMEIAGPLAGAALGGLVTTLGMTLFVLPLLYLGFGTEARSEEDFENLLEAVPDEK
ncbi:efflux RND transporter permease subunit [Candidatus Thiosymbion oneisti]|uniref:efflux RND transporter permease subunit n=1 Tax=Candidatus Thiosymbion oneisti TaxID=589554 RepID=UPI000ABF9CFD|nr:efflux RND transporter permease subunit [Candidatus Thiosymbion oneisti]